MVTEAHVCVAPVADVSLDEELVQVVVQERGELEEFQGVAPSLRILFLKNESLEEPVLLGVPGGEARALGSVVSNIPLVKDFLGAVQQRKPGVAGPFYQDSAPVAANFQQRDYPARARSFSSASQ